MEGGGGVEVEERADCSCKPISYQAWHGIEKWTGTYRLCGGQRGNDDAHNAQPGVQPTW